MNEELINSIVCNEWKEEFIEEKINTYKSVWFKSKITGNWKRLKKDRYLFEFIGKVSLIYKFSKLKAIAYLLGHKPEGSEFYSYYTRVIGEFIERGNMGKWKGEFEKVISDLYITNVSIDKKNILDISGEPGFFAKQLNNFANVIVTAYNKEVANAMSTMLDLHALKYDFNQDSLISLFPNIKFDIVFLRWCIGFKENIINLVEELKGITSESGVIYIQYSPPSKAIPARWMFDDYTYLRLWDMDFLIGVFRKFGFDLIYKKNEGSYKWDVNLHVLQKLVSYPYTLRFLRGQPDIEKYQHNYTLIFKKCSEHV